MTTTGSSQSADGWLIKHSKREHDHGNIPGIRYRFGRSLPNGKSGLQVGDIVVGFHVARDVSGSEGRLFGIGRIGSRLDVGDGERDDVYFDRFLMFDHPLSWDDFGGDPRNNQTNSIVRAPAAFIEAVMQAVSLSSMDDAPVPVMTQPISEAEFDAVLAKAGMAIPEADAPVTGALASLAVLDLATVEAWMEDLDFDGSNVVEQAIASIRAGKHLLLQGAPGTGKTTLAKALGEAAVEAGAIRGFSQITGSSDWTPSDTVGTYRLNREKDLEFVQGHILESVANDRWVILDELNRADIDRALGPLFSVLSGQATTLRYEEEKADGTSARIAIVPSGQTIEGCVNYEVSPNWRIIATMNTKDLDLLFEMSQAFLRRFAVLTIPCPSTSAHRSLLASYATGNASIDAMVGRLVSLPGTELGPAITLDCARYVAQRLVGLSTAPDVHILAEEIFGQYVRPQLNNLDDSRRRAVLHYLRSGGVTSPAGTPESDESNDDNLEP